MPQPASVPQDPPPLPETEAAIAAAIAHTFTIVAAPGSAQASEVDAAPFGELRIVRPVSEEERNIILAHATPITCGGQRRLQLSDEARGDLLTRVRGSELYRRLLSRTTRDDRRDSLKIGRDDIRLPGAWLRSFLADDPGDLFNAPPREVRAAVDALSRLQFAGREVMKKPVALADARRALELSELVEPLRILIGARGNWNGLPAEDRFVGREDEIKRLRGFVDELASQGALEAVVRGARRVVRNVQSYFNVSDESVFFIIARGGIGKTTLLAKFVLDHALNQSRPFPFCYFDFDRATLHARDPRQLLIEAARQVALQFPQVGPQITSLTAEVRRDLAGGVSLRFDDFDRFREIMRTITQGSRAFLVVLDTMEVVQYDPRALEAVVNFAIYLNGVEDPMAFPELKIVASGRADVPQLRTEQAQRSDKNRLVLQALSLADAAAMAQGVGRDFLGEAWNPQWASLVAGRPNDPPERREPLVIRVAVELIRGAKPEEREKLVQSIARDGENATKGFVGLLYERRILEHVQDEEVRKLAWPGLVVRRVTREIVAMLAPICDLDPDHVDQVFAALANEVWMVEEEEGGKVLRHRADLRARTLPLMRRRDEEKFEKVNSAALQYYVARTETVTGRAEWLYHRLLGGEPVDSVDRDWSDEMVTPLAGAADDFAPDSATRAYLLARTARTLLPPELIAKLPPRLALDHVAHTGGQLGTFDDTRIEPVIADLAARITAPDVTTSEPHPVKGVILTKAGRWDVAVTFDGGSSEWRQHAEFAAYFRFARIAPESMGDRPGIPDTTLPVRVLIQALARARVMGSPANNELDEIVAGRLREPIVNPGPTDIAALRTAVVVGQRASAPAARAWFALQEAPGAPKAVSLAEFSALLDVSRSERSVLRAALEPALESFKLSWTELARAARAKKREPMRIGHPSVRRALLSCAQHMLDRDDPDAMHVLRRFFAARDDDWIVPYGYAAALALGPLRDAADVFAAANPDSDWRSTYERGFRPPEDTLQLFRWADEASNIEGIASACLRIWSRPLDPLGFVQLQFRYPVWRRLLNDLLARNEVEGRDDAPAGGNVVNPDDCQQGRWGGAPERNGRRLEAVLGEVERDTFTIDLIVRSTDDTALKGPVLFHLRDSYPRQTLYINRMRDRDSAVLKEVDAYGTFTVGAQVRGADGRWAALELDLAKLPNIPTRFIGR